MSESKLPYLYTATIKLDVPGISVDGLSPVSDPVKLNFLSQDKMIAELTRYIKSNPPSNFIDISIRSEVLCENFVTPEELILAVDAAKVQVREETIKELKLQREVIENSQKNRAERILNSDTLAVQKPDVADGSDLTGAPSTNFAPAVDRTSEEAKRQEINKEWAIGKENYMRAALESFDGPPVAESMKD